MNAQATDLTTDELLEGFEYTVQRNHYDPMGSEEPRFCYDMLKKELKRRLELVDPKPIRDEEETD